MGKLSFYLRNLYLLDEVITCEIGVYCNQKSICRVLLSKPKNTEGYYDDGIKRIYKRVMGKNTTYV
jgi:hypothetical protein